MQIPARLCRLLAVLLLVALGASYLVAISRKTLTNDELIHIPAGYYYWTFGDFQLNSEHPPLVKLWATLPLLLFPKMSPFPPPEVSVEDRFTFFMGFWQSHARAFRSLALWPRLMMIPFPILLGLLVFVYARKLFGDMAGLLALFLYCVEPTILAHGRIVHTDVPGALGYLSFFFLLHRYLEKPEMKRAIALGLGAAGALVVKFSMVVLAPVLVAIFFIEIVFTSRSERGRAAARVLAVGAIVILVINAAYFFEHPPLNKTDHAIVAAQSPYADGAASLVPYVSAVLPTYFPFGAYLVMAHNGYGHAASLLGMQGATGWWYYFPIAFALKTTIPFLAISIASFVWAIYQVTRSRSLDYLSLVAPAALYGILSMSSHIDIGVRHILPVFPFLFILSGGFLAAILSRWRIAGSVLAAAVLSWTLVEAVRVFPDYTAYMNPLARGPSWRYLSDSNVEWGDDVPDLAAYLQARGITRIRGALMGGGTTLAYLGIDCGNLLGIPGPDTDYVALGASYLNGSTIPYGGRGSGRETDQQRVDYFAAYRALKPEAVFGGSIFLYRVR